MKTERTNVPSASALLSLLNLCRLNSRQKEQAVTLAHDIRDWNGLLDLAEQNSATILTADRILELNLLPSPSPHDAGRFFQFLEKAKALKQAAEARTRHVTKILKAAHSEHLEVIVLKGGMLGSVLYGNPNYKKMNDIDVLVRFEDARRLAGLLRRKDFLSVGQLFGEEEFSDKSHHSPPFVSRDLKCMVGLHWGLTSPYARWKHDTGEIWQRKLAVTVCSAPAFRMSWEDNLLHLCIHLPFFKVGVRELADVYNIGLFAQPGIDWKCFDALVEKWRAEDAAWRVLSLSDCLQPLGVPRELLDKWQQHVTSFTRNDTMRRLALGQALIATRSVHIGKIEKAFSILRISRNFPERFFAWAATWKLTFWPKALELPRLQGVLPGQTTWLWSRLTAGYHCWNAMARDYGQIPLTVVTLANVGIVMREMVLWPFRGKHSPIRKSEHYKILEALE